MANEQESLTPETPSEDLTGAPIEAVVNVAALEARVAELEDARLRALADADNIRRRALEDVARAQKFAVERFARELLPVKDSLEMALLDNSSIDNLKAGVELTLKQLVAAFEKSHLLEVNPVGDKLDPHRHQAISMIEAEAEANTVVQVMQKGYLLHDRVIRPAMVVVSKGK